MTETAASSLPKTADSAAVVGAPPLAPATAPLCYVVDDEPSIRHFLSLVLHGSGVDTMEFPDGAALRKAMVGRVPDLVFHNVSLESADAIETVVSFGKHGFPGAVHGIFAPPAEAKPVAAGATAGASSGSSARPREEGRE